MRDSRVALVAAAGLLVGVALILGQSTSARWTADIRLAGTAVSTGVLDVRVDGQDGISRYGLLDLSGAVPGASRSAELTVSNEGTVPLGYTVEVAGTNGDGKGLANSLAVQVAGGECGGPVLGGDRVIAPGRSEQLCVRVTLPSTAPAAVAGAATALTVSITSSNGGWSDSAAVTGSSVTTAALVSPKLTCGSALLGSIVLGWDAVPHATAYRIHYGSTGQLVQTVPAGTLTSTFAGVTGVASVEAVFGSSGWVSAPSPPLAYPAGLLGDCD